MARMSHNPGEEPLLSDPKRLLLDMAQEHALPELLRLIVARLSDSPRVALARIWLARPTADCTGCPHGRGLRGPIQVSPTGGQRRAVHRRPRPPSGPALDGAFRRIPLGVRKVGRIAATGEPIEAPDLAEPFPDWVARPGLGAGRGDPAGSAASRSSTAGRCSACWPCSPAGPSGAECMDWLRMIADHAAAAIATARAFERIEELRAKLELENEYLREEVTRAGAFGELVGQGPALEAVARQIDLVAPTDAAVLILGRERHGQGAGRPRAAPAEQRAARPLDQGELRRGAARAVRERVLRPRPGRVHRGAARPGRAVRAGRRRDAVPRRGGRDPAGAAGEAAAGAPGGGAGAGRRGAHPEGRRAADRRHQPRPAGRGRGRAVPAGPVLPAERVPDRAAAAAEAGGGHPAAGRALPGPGRPQARAGRSRG